MMRFVLVVAPIVFRCCSAFLVTGPQILQRGSLFWDESRSGPRQFCSSEHCGQEPALYEELCRDLEEPFRSNTYLQSSAIGLRGVRVSKPIASGESILTIPINHKCVRDDELPFDSVMDENLDPYSTDRWACRLAAAFLRRQADPDPSFDLYSSLLPDPELLAASLPLNWRSDLLTYASSTALELHVDTAYFARAQAVESLLVWGKQYTKEQVQYALDIVQTRSCRLTLEDGRIVRCLVPVFDMINHSDKPNAEFTYQDGALLVRAIVDLREGDEVFLDYGSAARPAARCLSSYGFVPDFSPDDELATAEVYLDGVRYEVGPSSIPEAMVGALMVDNPNRSSEDLALTPNIATRLAQRLDVVAFQLLLDPLEGEQDDETAAGLLSAHLAKSLRWYQHNVLTTCSAGLREWALEYEVQSQTA